jgi:hypothetical protein
MRSAKIVRFSKASINPDGKQDASRDTGDCCSLLGATEMRLANFRVVVGLSPVSDEEPESPGSSFTRSCLFVFTGFAGPGEIHEAIRSTASKSTFV